MHLSLADFGAEAEAPPWILIESIQSTIDRPLPQDGCLPGAVAGRRKRRSDESKRHTISMYTCTHGQLKQPMPNADADGTEEHMRIAVVTAGDANEFFGIEPIP